LTDTWNSIVDDAIDEWHKRLQACVDEKRSWLNICCDMEAQVQTSCVCLCTVISSDAHFRHSNHFVTYYSPTRVLQSNTVPFLLHDAMQVRPMSSCSVCLSRLRILSKSINISFKNFHRAVSKPFKLEI